MNRLLLAATLLLVACGGTSAPDLVDAAVDGPAGKLCGGFLGEPCASADFCNYEEGCGMADQSGVCNVRPTLCPKNIDPVCGCDGMDYDNECEANRAGFDISRKGRCATP